MSSNTSCISEVTTVISRLKTYDEKRDHGEEPSSASVRSEDSSNTSPAESPSPTIRFERFGDTSSHDSLTYHCPIIGHEVMEERARFTVYKLRVENPSSEECWFVFRRYTDFVRLHSTLKTEFPSLNITLPRKRWFGDNFNPTFIEDRMKGLQEFVDRILNNRTLQLSLSVREFFCLDEPPSALESIDESRAIFEALEETLQQLRSQLMERDLALETTKASLVQQTLENERLVQLTRDCPHCSKEPSLPPPSTSTDLSS